MPDRLYESHGVRILECAPDRPQPRSDRDMVDLIGLAGENDAAIVVLHAAWLGDDFFHLKTRLAGEILQKFITYHSHVVILGDISRYIEESAALRDFVHEANRGSQIWFVSTIEELDAWLARRPS